MPEGVPNMGLLWDRKGEGSTTTQWRNYSSQPINELTQIIDPLSY
jgi:hypothetical protein